MPDRGEPIELSLEIAAGKIGFIPQDLSEWVATKVLRLFEISVAATVFITVALALVDAVGMWNHVIQPSDRLVTEKVLMTLIGASVVQVGAASAAIVYALFRKPAASTEPPA